MDEKDPLLIITLNVGGRKFQTLRKTLLSVPGTFFVGMLECAEEEYFIDRDGENFAQVLNFLRGAVSIDAVDPDDARFYALPVRPTANSKKLFINEVKRRHNPVAAYLGRYEEDIWSAIARIYSSELDIHYDNVIFHDRQLHIGLGKPNGVVFFMRSDGILQTRLRFIEMEEMGRSKRVDASNPQAINPAFLSRLQVEEESVEWKAELCKLVAPKHSARCSTQFYVVKKLLESHFSSEGMQNEMTTAREIYNNVWGFRIEWTFVFSESPLWINEVLSKSAVF